MQYFFDTITIRLKMGDVCLMKINLVKVVACVVTATILVLSVATCFAATANTTTTYLANGKVKVRSELSEIPEGTMVTYLACPQSGVSSKGDIYYIQQGKASAEGLFTFQFEIPADKVTIGGISSVVKYGSNNSTVASALNADTGKNVQVNQVTVTGNIASAVEAYVGTNNSVAITVEPAAGYEILGAYINGSETLTTSETNTFTVPYAAAPTLVVKTQATVAPMTLTPASAQFAATTGSGAALNTLGLVVQVANAAEGVTEYGIYVADANGNALVLDAEDAFGGYYPSAGANNEGYYAVNVATAASLDGYTAKAYYKDATGYHVVD